MLGVDTHTLVDVVTLLLAVGSGIHGLYRSLFGRIAKLEEKTAIHEGILKGAGLL